MDIEQLNRIELDVFDSICDVMNSNWVNEKIRKFEQETKEDFKIISDKYQIKNKVNLGFQRLLQTIFYNPTLLNKLSKEKLKFKNPYLSPLSSDLAFYLENCLINIDAKTTHIHTNGGDIHTRDLKENQVTFTESTGESFYKGEKLKLKDFTGSLPAYTTKNNLPSFSFFIGLVYFDDYFDSSNLSLEFITISCIPHKDIIEKKLHNKKILQNSKSYSYFNSKIVAKNLGGSEKYEPIKSTDFKFEEYEKINDTNLIGGDLYIPIDKNQINKTTGTRIIRKVMKNGEEYQVVYSPSSSRVNNYNNKPAKISYLDENSTFFLSDYSRFKALANNQEISINQIEEIIDSYKNKSVKGHSNCKWCKNNSI